MEKSWFISERCRESYAATNDTMFSSLFGSEADKLILNLDLPFAESKLAYYVQVNSNKPKSNCQLKIILKDRHIIF